MVENEHGAAAMVELAHGARTLGQLTRALGLVRIARKVASERGDERALAQADALEKAIREGGPPDRDKRAPVAVRRFVSRLVARVERS